MKCEFCAGNISIEDERCPHCDAKNPHFEAHRKAMAKYYKEFTNIENDVVEKTQKFSRRTFNITIISVLVALIAVCIVVLINIDDINYNRERAKNKRQADAIAARMAKMEEEEDFIGLSDYNNSLAMSTYKTKVAEYQYVCSLANNYNYMFTNLDRMIYHEKSYSSASEFAKYMNNYLSEAYRIRYEEYEKHPDLPGFNKIHLDSMDKMISTMHSWLKAYVHLSDEEIDSLKDMSDAERQFLLEQRIERLISEDEE